MQVHRRLMITQPGVGRLHLDDDGRLQVGACVLILQKSAGELGFTASKAAADRAMHACMTFLRPKSSYDEWELQNLIDPILGLITVYRDEMEGQKVMVLPSKAAEQYAAPEAAFGSASISAFPSIEDDVREAVRCLALQRSTASVFHCMRIMEVGLEALSRELNVAIATNWNNALNLVEKEIRSRSTATHGSGWKNDEAFYSEAATHFRVVKNAWRNHTMHKRERFDEERARGILQSTAEFMRHLATRLSE
jgi:hypothetical protein